jgi:hypothetical protein
VDCCEGPATSAVSSDDHLGMCVPIRNVCHHADFPRSQASRPA